MNVVSYSRLSKDDNKGRYSSIEAQQQLALDYAKKKNWTIQKAYIDDDFSGYIENEKRPNFYEMFQLLEEGKIDVVIAKDLSRVGRNGAITLSNIEVFKDLGANLILTKDPMLGEFNLKEHGDDMIGLLTWLNERYVRDTSVKVKAGMHNRQKNGLLIQGFKFGYKKTDKKGELIIDETIRDTITTIFNLYEQGFGMRKICYILNKEYDFLTPSQVIARDLQAKGKAYGKLVSPLWNIYMIERILGDELYMGTLVTHKKEVVGIHKKSIKVNKENQYTFPNHHEAIISEEQFYNVQEIRKIRQESTAFYNKKANDYIFGGFLKCGECKGSVTGVVRKRSKKQNYVAKPFYECVNYRKYGVSRCVSHIAYEYYILANFKQFLMVLKEEYQEELENMTLESAKNKSENKVNILKKELEQAKAEYKVLLSQKIKDLSFADEENQDFITNSYLELEKEKSISIKSLKKRIVEIENEKLEQKQEKLKTAIEYFKEIINNPKPNKAILNMILNKIYIYHDKTLEFDLKINIKELVAQS